MDRLVLKMMAIAQGEFFHTLCTQQIPGNRAAVAKR
jgi:hypothetical protein